MAISTTKGSGVPRNNTGAMVVAGTTASNSPIKQSLGRTLSLGFPSRTKRTTFQDNANTSAITASGPMAYQEAGKYVILGQSTTLAGVSNTTIARTGANFARPPHHAMTRRYTLRQITAGWNFATGAFLSAPTLAIDYFGNNSSAPGRDDAATPTRAIPGELVIAQGANGAGAGNEPKLVDYPAKTG